MYTISSQHLPSTDHGGKTLIEYVWLGSSGSDLRSKTQVLDFRPSCAEEVPIVAVDGSSYGMAPEDNEVFLKPRKIFCDPFRGGGHLLVLCDSFQANVDTFENTAMGFQGPMFKPHPANNRAPCEDVLNRAGDSGAAFAVEQEYTIIQASSAQMDKAPAYLKSGDVVACSGDALPDPALHSTVPGTAGIRQRACVGRTLAERHLKSCLDAGVNITEVSQRGSSAVWSYKIGPLSGLDLADQLWVSRFLMLRVSEAEGVVVSFDPLANGSVSERSRCLVAYSTAATRQPGIGLSFIQQQISCLQAAHLQHALAYGKGSMQLLSDSTFSVGVGNKAAAIVVPTTTIMQQAGHYIDCRPASNMDPYLVIMMMLSTTLQLPLPFMQCMPHDNGKHQSMARSSTHSAVSQAWPVELDRRYSSTVWADSDDDCSSINSEEVLIDELDKLDSLGPDTPPRYSNILCGSPMEGFDESKCESYGSGSRRQCF